MIYLTYSFKLKEQELKILESYFQDTSIFPLDNYFQDFPTLFLFLENIPLGFLTYQEILDEVHILNFGIKKTFQGKGFGKLFLKFFLYNVNKKNIFLEVFKDNRKAINLYKKFNFKIIGVRKNFYKGKDAYIMMREKR